MLILVILFSLVWILLCTFLFKNLRTKPGILLAIIVILALIGGFFGLALASFPMLILTVGTVLVVASFLALRTPPSAWRLGLMLTALAGIGIGIGGYPFQSYFDKIAAMQAEIPLEKLSERLPAVSQFVLTSTPVLSHEDPQRMHEKTERRMVGLKALHADRVSQFIDSPGFGLNRMAHVRMFYFSQQLPPERPVVPIKLDSGQYQIFEGLTEARLKDYHEQGVKDFVNPAGYGWVKEKQSVAGFHEHQFSQRPAIIWDGVTERRDRLNIVQLQLVSVLKHDPPMVYQSVNLPRMDELKNSEVRSLTPFETKGLLSLHSGESPKIYFRRNDKTVNMLGAIRARSDCTDCHHVPEGTLLGAFSYELQEIDSIDYVPQDTVDN